MILFGDIVNWRQTLYNVAMPKDQDQSLLDAVRRSFYAAGAPESILLGLSGGADSMALLMVLLDLRKSEGFRLTCVHVNHHLRAASDNEAKWLSSLLQLRDIPLIVKDVKVPGRGSLEAAARQVRYVAFAEAMRESGAQVLALAHHANDQAETMLMRFMHGTGPAGLAAMGERSGDIWRPFLQTPKADLVQFLLACGQKWIEDASNQDQRMLRNAIRHQVMPGIEALAPGSALRMAKTAALMHDEEKAWKVITGRWLVRHASLDKPFVFLLIEPFLKEPLAFQRRLVRRLCQGFGIDLDRSQTDALCELPNAPKPAKMNLPGGAYALCSASRLHVVPAAPDPPLPPLEGWLEPTDTPGGLGDGKRLQTFDAEKLAGASLRYAQAGDRISPLGMEGSQSMAQYLSDRKIDQPFRRCWPVLAKRNQVLWAIGLGAAQTAAVTERTKDRIQYVFKGRLPGDIGPMMEEE